MYSRIFSCKTTEQTRAKNSILAQPAVRQPLCIFLARADFFRKPLCGDGGSFCPARRFYLDAERKEKQNNSQSIKWH